MRIRRGDLVREHRVLSLVFFIYYLGLIGYGVATGASQTIFYALFLAAGGAWLCG